MISRRSFFDEIGDGGENTAAGQAGRTGVHGGESTPSGDGRRGDELVAHTSTSARVHLLLTDVEELMVDIEFGARIVNFAETTCIKLDYTGLFSSLGAAC
jgi:hypothetical protein